MDQFLSQFFVLFYFLNRYLNVQYYIQQVATCSVRVNSSSIMPSNIFLRLPYYGVMGF